MPTRLTRSHSGGDWVFHREGCRQQEGEDPNTLLVPVTSVNVQRPRRSAPGKGFSPLPIPPPTEARTDGDYTIVRRRTRPVDRPEMGEETTPVNREESRAPSALEKPNVGHADPAEDEDMAEMDMHTSEGPACTYGRFEALMDEDMKSEADSSDRDDEGKDSDSNNDDAAYAFPDDGNTEEVDVIMMDETQSLNALSPRGQRIVETLSLASDVAMGMAEATSGTEVKASSSLDSEGNLTLSYIGSSAPTHSQDTAPTPGSDFPYSLASTSSDLRSDKLAQPTPPLGQTSKLATLETVEPEPEVEYVTTIATARNPTQAAFWLSWFGGREVSVPDAGQCAILAFYATVTNHDAGSLKLSPAVTKDVNSHKKAIYCLMLANLRTDVLLGLIDPTQELARLYPACPSPDSRELATALLFQHLLIERNRSVARRVPCAHWATSNVLRTYAQYLRQPLLVLDGRKW
ncbi:uncharacterized protein PITG_20977 [Phytophthora infestans T30-4]|uniref:Uncharacterized protein n=1 Tax=Phytophthora infestans (strain T30-4) TaxID=403677 RepID=D0P3U2_PHYIT|nr:uncharacterized protein PITG_20977 [Phytophthora infestans T30-4]EEY61758.1 conserved hypothetical protein [Phytophthora infestans T30-4]|eukprot:XP_002895033.1 conserved hypothetical protein [Phytophthora infestans T30-4]